MTVRKTRPKEKPEYGGGKYTRSKFIARFLRQPLRQMSRYWPPIAKVRARARIGRGKYKCEMCGKIVPKVDVDHINGLPSLDYWSTDTLDKLKYAIGSWVLALFCEEEDLQAICPPCHKGKTKMERSVGDG